MRVPSRPRNLVATLDRGIRVTLTWTEPEHTCMNSARITVYDIQYGRLRTNEYTSDESIELLETGRDDDEYKHLYVGGNTTNFQFTGQLKESTNYQFAVAAVNAAGRGKFSEFTSVRTQWEVGAIDAAALGPFLK